MNRLFAFGCSFTNYQWPTWADIVGKQFETFENWGQPGAGNQYIFNALTECHLKNQITPNDTVIIMWSSICREDRYIKGQWITRGNVYTGNSVEKDYLDNFVDNRGFLIRDLSLIFGAKNILDNIGCKYIFLSMCPLTTINDYENCLCTDIVSDILPYYESLLNTIRPSVFQIIFNFNWDSRPFEIKGAENFWKSWYNKIKDSSWPDLIEKKDYLHLPEYIKKECKEVFGFFIPNFTTQTSRADYHPTPLEHLEYVEKVLPEFNISESVRLWVAECDESVRNNTWKTPPQQIKRW